jgi:hypothetical protein
VKVVEHIPIKGVGISTVVDVLDDKVIVGSLVRRVGTPFTWRVKRLSTWLMGRKADTGLPGKFVLHGQTSLPPVGAELETVDEPAKA